MTHQLDTYPGEFEAVRTGEMMHAVRLADRNYNVGDTIILREWVPTDATKTEIRAGNYTGRFVMRKLTYLTVAGSWGLPSDICVFTIK